MNYLPFLALVKLSKAPTPSQRLRVLVLLTQKVGVVIFVDSGFPLQALFAFMWKKKDVSAQNLLIVQIKFCRKICVCGGEIIVNSRELQTLDSEAWTDVRNVGRSFHGRLLFGPFMSRDIQLFNRGSALDVYWPPESAESRSFAFSSSGLSHQPSAYPA